MRFIRLALAGVIMLLAATAAAAQGSGALDVRVVDPQGNPLPGATVTISHPLNYVKATSYMTDAGGIASFPVLRPGKGYQVTVSFPLYAQLTQNVDVTFGENKLPVTMIGKIEEQVTVVAKSDTIDLEQQESITRFTDEFIQDLPVAGRFYQNVLTLAPGVQDADGDGNPNVHGSRSRDFKMEVGGISNVDPLTGQWMSRVNPNSIEEMEVITSGAGAEFGRAQGGFGRIIQKQGSNEHEGVFEFYYQSSKLNGTGAADQSNLPDVSTDWFQPSVQFSGPILKDKLWYRLSHEIFNIDHAVNVSSDLLVQEEKAGTHDDLLTWQVSPRNKLQLQYQTDPYEISNQGISSVRGSESSWREKRTGSTYKLSWTAPYSPKVLVDSVLSWQDLNTGRFPNSTGVANDCLVGANFLEEAYCFNNVTGEFSGSFPRTEDDHRQRLTMRSDTTLYGGRFWGMSHQFGMGVVVENERYFRHLKFTPATDFFRVQAFGVDGIPDPDAASQTFAVVRLAVPGEDDVRATGTNWGLHMEDQFKPRQNLTVTVGVRVEREELNSEGNRPFDPADEVAHYIDQGAQGISADIAQQTSFTAYEDLPSFRAELQGLICRRTPGVPEETDKQYNRCLIQLSTAGGGSTIESIQRFRANENINLVNTNISPSIAVAWSPWSNGKTALKASYNRHYNPLPLVIPLQELNPAFTNLLYEVFGDRSVELNEAADPSVNVQVVSRDLRTPYADELAFNFERQLWTETTLRVSFINRKYRDQIQDINRNYAPGDFGRCVPASGGGFTVTPSFGIGPNDDDPGVGDTLDPNLFDDCIGETYSIEDQGGKGGGGGQPGEDRGTLFQRPDGTPDLYQLNPFWGDIFEIGNYNKADYNAVVTELTRRQYRSWELQASYTWSRLIGDGEDFFQEIGDDPSLRQNERGFQANDQRHVVKMNATSITPWGIRLGTAVSWQSGLPFSMLRRKLAIDTITPAVASFDTPAPAARPRLVYLTGERNDQRNDSYWNVDLRATRELTLGRNLNLQLSAEIFNVLNDGTYIVFNDDLDYGQQVNGRNEARRRFGRTWQLGMKLAF